jgi:hypothetical protein
MDCELRQHSAKPKSLAILSDTDAVRAIFVVDTNRDHGALEARVGHPRHREQELAGQELRSVHAPKMDSADVGGKS